MRKFAAAYLVVAVMSSAAAAADLDPPYARGPIYEAPPPILLYSWHGFYAGAHIGGGWRDSDVNGFLAGVQAGYNIWMNNVVLGVEAEWTWEGNNGDDDDDTALVVLPGAGSGSLRTESDGIATLTARLGYTRERSLFYVKGGAAWARDSFAATVATTPPLTFTADETRSGWTMGFGYEYAFRGAWSARIEYMFIDFGGDGVTLRGPGGSILVTDVDQQIHTVKLGINYRFTWPPFGTGY